MCYTVVHYVSKNDIDLACYNSDVHPLTFDIFWHKGARSVTVLLRE